jgi:hypothetical protein
MQASHAFCNGCRPICSLVLLSVNFTSGQWMLWLHLVQAIATAHKMNPSGWHLSHSLAAVAHKELYSCNTIYAYVHALQMHVEMWMHVHTSRPVHNTINMWTVQPEAEQCWYVTYHVIPVTYQSQTSHRC